MAARILTLSSTQVPSSSGLQIFCMGRQLLRNMMVVTMSVKLRLTTTLSITLRIDSVQPEEDILRRKNPKDTLDHTEEAMVRMEARVDPQSRIALIPSLSINWMWRPRPRVVAYVM